MWVENATKPVIYHLSVNDNKVQLLSLKAHLNNLGHNHTLCFRADCDQNQD